MHGFYRDLDFDASFAFPWAVRFRKRNEPFHRVIGEYERKFREYQQEATAQRTLALEERIKIENLQNHTAQLEDAVHDYPHSWQTQNGHATRQKLVWTSWRQS